MSANTIRVQVGPANYYSFTGAIDKLSEFYPQPVLEKALWIYGERALNAAQDYLPAEFHSANAIKARFNSHCSESTVAELVSVAGSERQVVIGVGGGGVLDTAKVVARRLGLPLVVIPTIAATCAAWTPLSVWYTEQGQALNYEIFNDANHLVLVEPRIILQAPVAYLLAGIGDTLAKWYEAVVLSSDPKSLPLTVRLGLQAALDVRNVLLEQSEAALQAVARRELTQDFLDVVDAIIAGGGMVGGLGERFTRVAAAHAVHNGLTVLPQTAHFLHGTKVAYGILVQTALLGQEQALKDLIAAFKVWGLPTHLAALDVNIRDRDAIEQVITRILKPGESIHALPISLNKQKIRAAIEQVDIAAQAL